MTIRLAALAPVLALSLALASCNKDKGGNAATGAAAATSEADVKVTTPVVKPANGDWSQSYAATSAGGFLMGNPDAKLKLVEYASMTCSHCAEFETLESEKLVEGYVKDGTMSWEIRNYIRDPYDLAVALVARCGGAPSFFGMTRGLFTGQRDWMGRLTNVSQADAAALEQMGVGDRFKKIVDLAGLYDFAALRGISREKIDACLADEKEASRLVDLTTAANNSYTIPGTPTFVLNGKLIELVENQPLWPQLKAKFDEAKR